MPLLCLLVRYFLHSPKNYLNEEKVLLARGSSHDFPGFVVQMM